MELTKVVVDGEKWYRGKKHYSKLLIGPKTVEIAKEDRTDISNEVGKMCCLGFASLAKGKSVEDIVDESFPETEWFGLNRGKDGRDWFYTLAVVNDSTDYESDLKRAERLKREGLKIGIKFEFINIGEDTNGVD